jgi:hypothetical protein
LQRTPNEIESLNGSCSPALIAKNGCPNNRNSTLSTFAAVMDQTRSMRDFGKIFT